MMIWVYFIVYIFLYGVQLNYIYRGEFSRKGWFKRLTAYARAHKNSDNSDNADNTDNAENKLDS